MFFVLDEIASFAFSLDILFKRQVMQSYSLFLIENLASCSKEDIGEIEDERMWRLLDDGEKRGGKGGISAPPSLGFGISR